MHRTREGYLNTGQGQLTTDDLAEVETLVAELQRESATRIKAAIAEVEFIRLKWTQAGSSDDSTKEVSPVEHQTNAIKNLRNVVRRVWIRNT